MISKRIPKAYSIWLIPNGENYILLKNTIIELSHIFKGIKFLPHVTVVSNLDYSEKFLSKKIERIAKKVEPFNIEFNSINYLDEFFQSFFISVKINNDLAYIRKVAKSFFPKMTEKYNPHLSLAYGNIKSKIKKNLKSEIHCPIKNFKATELYLAYNDEVNLKWEIINKFPLKQ
jgi:2'-5' RNA ligase